MLAQEAARHEDLSSSARLTLGETNLYQRLADAEATPEELAWSLKTLSRLLQKHTAPALAQGVLNGVRKVAREVYPDRGIFSSFNNPEVVWCPTANQAWAAPT